MQDVKRSIEQNLIDAGVDADVIKSFCVWKSSITRPNN